MLLSLPANPVPPDLYHYVNSAGAATTWLPWYIWGGGVYSTKYGYNTSKFFGYLGTVSVPLANAPACPVIVKSLRMIGAVNGKQGANEGAMVRAILWQRTNNVSSPIATIVEDRRNVVVSNVYIDITQSANNFAATPSIHSLAIEILGLGQGVATIHGLMVELQY